MKAERANSRERTKNRERASQGERTIYGERARENIEERTTLGSEPSARRASHSHERAII
jgi:hypothetical protein